MFGVTLLRRPTGGRVALGLTLPRLPSSASRPTAGPMGPEVTVVDTPLDNALEILLQVAAGPVENGPGVPLVATPRLPLGGVGAARPPPAPPDKTGTRAPETGRRVLTAVTVTVAGPLRVPTALATVTSAAKATGVGRTPGLRPPKTFLGLA